MRQVERLLRFTYYPKFQQILSLKYQLPTDDVLAMYDTLIQEYREDVLRRLKDGLNDSQPISPTSVQYNPNNSQNLDQMIQYSINRRRELLENRHRSLKELNDWHGLDYTTDPSFVPIRKDGELVGTFRIGGVG